MYPVKETMLRNHFIIQLKKIINAGALVFTPRSSYRFWCSGETVSLHFSSAAVISGTA